MAAGTIEIALTAQGERMRFAVLSPPAGLQAEVRIARPGRTEVLKLSAADQPGVFWSAAALQEPHEFSAELVLQAQGRSEAISFQMAEPTHAH